MNKAPKKRFAIPARVQLPIVVLLIPVVWIPAWLSHARSSAAKLEAAETRVAAMAAEKAVLFRGLETWVGEADWLEAKRLDDGSRWRADAQFDGILYVFSTGCVFSPTNIPTLQGLSDAGITIVGVAVDDDHRQVATWADLNGVRFPVVVDAEGPLSVLLEFGTPYTLVVSGGRLGFGVLGVLPDNEVQRLLSLADAVEGVELQRADSGVRRP